MHSCELKLDRSLIANSGAAARELPVVLSLVLLLGLLIFGIALELSGPKAPPTGSEPFSRPHYSMGRML